MTKWSKKLIANLWCLYDSSASFEDSHEGRENLSFMNSFLTTGRNNHICLMAFSTRIWRHLKRKISNRWCCCGCCGCCCCRSGICHCCCCCCCCGCRCCCYCCCCCCCWREGYFNAATVVVAVLDSTSAAVICCHESLELNLRSSVSWAEHSEFSLGVLHTISFHQSTIAS